MADSFDVENIRSLADRKLISVSLGTSVDEGLELAQLRGVHHLAVVNPKAEIVGLLLEKEIAGLHESRRLSVDIFMSKPVEQVHQDSSLRSVALRMLEKKTSAVLVINDAHQAVGIITSDDLLWQLAHLLKDEKSVSPPLSSLLSLQTLGRVANDLASVGI